MAEKPEEKPTLKKAMALINKTRKRAMKYVQKTVTGCWEWAGGYRNGYGAFWYLGKTGKASRIFYMLFVGEIPKGKFVLHRCDNKKCVNPKHLWIGTQMQNYHDAVVKGRMRYAVGKKLPQTKLSDHQVKLIRRLAGRYTQQALADRFEVSQGNVGHILCGRSRRAVLR